MKLIVSILFSFSLNALALDPAQTTTPQDPTAAPTGSHDNIIGPADGALKVEKTPAKIEGLNHPEDGKKPSSKKSKKNKKSEEQQIK